MEYQSVNMRHALWIRDQTRISSDMTDPAKRHRCFHISAAHTVQYMSAAQNDASTSTVCSRKHRFEFIFNGRQYCCYLLFIREKSTSHTWTILATFRRAYCHVRVRALSFGSWAASTSSCITKGDIPCLGIGTGIDPRKLDFYFAS